MPHQETSNLWQMARSGRPIDAERFASALADEARAAETDFRTELLVRDGLDALSRHWGPTRTARWLDAQPGADRLRALWRAELGPAGFPSLNTRIMDATHPEDVLAFFRELGARSTEPARLDVGGSTSLILAGLLSRQTDDIDVVDEVPAAIREQHGLLRELAGAYGLNLTHFQSRHLPAGWRDRVRSLGRFGRLDVFLVDVYDVLAGKLTSARRKDRDDLRALAPTVDRQVLAERLRTAGAAFLAEPKLAENARQNWYIVYGESLPA